MTDDVAVSTEIQVDDETRAALLLFNERVEASAAKARGAKRVAKAERAKDEAAAVVRKLGENPGASAEDKANAEAAYKEAVAEYNTIKENPLAGEKPRKPKVEAEATDEPTEVSADEEPSAGEAETNEATAPEGETKSEADSPADSEE